MKKFIFSVLAALLCLAAAPPSSPPSGRGAYRIGTGDRLRIEVWQEQDLTGVYAVSKSGNLNLNWVEPVFVQGLTLDETRARLETALRKYIRQPVVNISIEQYQSQKVTVLGEVKLPGQYYLRNENLLLEVILKDAGGLTNGAGESVTLIRPEKEGFQETRLNLKKMLEGDRTQNPTLQDGDTIVVNRSDSGGVAVGANDSAMVLGEVSKAGTFRVPDGYTVLQAILDAGGFTKYASPNRVKLVRGSGKEKKEYLLRIKDVMSDGDKTKDMAVVPGDIIIVPRSIL